MLLNLLRVEEADPEVMIQHSFLQFQSTLRAPRLVDQAKRLEGEAVQLVVEGETDVVAYCKALAELEGVREEIRRVVNQARYTVPFLQPGRLVRIKVGGASPSGVGVGCVP